MSEELTRKLHVHNAIRYSCGDCKEEAFYNSCTDLVTCYHCGTVWGYDGLARGVTGVEYDLEIEDDDGDTVDAVPFSRAKKYSHQCHYCNGRGIRWYETFPYWRTFPCERCEGRGWIFDQHEYEVRSES